VRRWCAACGVSTAPRVTVLATAVVSRCSEKLDDAQVEDLLERVVQLFTFVTDKDLFGDIYRCALRPVVYSTLCWCPCSRCACARRCTCDVV
jgi:hypothetical protein